MKVLNEITTVAELIDNLWSGGKSNTEDFIKAGYAEELMAVLEDMASCYECAMTETELNDLLWFEADYIAEVMGTTFEDVVHKASLEW